MQKWPSSYRILYSVSQSFFYLQLFWRFEIQILNKKIMIISWECLSLCIPFLIDKLFSSFPWNRSLYFLRSVAQHQSRLQQSSKFNFHKRQQRKLLLLQCEFLIYWPHNGYPVKISLFWLKYHMNFSRAHSKSMQKH